MNNNDSKEFLLQAAFELVAQQQQTLITAIFPSAHDEVVDEFDPRGMAIYRNNLLATARQALAISFPTVLTLIGEGLFNYACRELLISSPPKHGDWALWGDDFPTLLSGLVQLVDYPFVTDIAQVDLLRQQSMRAKDSVIDQASLQLLATHDIDELYIELTPSQFCMTANYPVIEFWLAHQQGMVSDTKKELNQKFIQQSLDKLAQGDFSQKVLIYRPYFNAEILELSASEYAWLTLIKQGVSIGKALDIMSNNHQLEHDFDFAQWIGIALEQNLINQLKV
jgi:Putative DNA-binding domain